MRNDVPSDPYQMPREPVPGHGAGVHPQGDVPRALHAGGAGRVAATLTQPAAAQRRGAGAGQAAVRRNCSVCHGPLGEGNGPVVNAQTSSRTRPAAERAAHAGALGRLHVRGDRRGPRPDAAVRRAHHARGPLGGGALRPPAAGRGRGGTAPGGLGRAAGEPGGDGHPDAGTATSTGAATRTARRPTPPRRSRPDTHRNIRTMSARFSDSADDSLPHPRRCPARCWGLVAVLVLVGAVVGLPGAGEARPGVAGVPLQLAVLVVGGDRDGDVRGGAAPDQRRAGPGPSGASRWAAWPSCRCRCSSSPSSSSGGASTLLPPLAARGGTTRCIDAKARVAQPGGPGHPRPDRAAGAVRAGDGLRLLLAAAGRVRAATRARSRCTPG